MLEAGVVQTHEDLQQILDLQEANLKQNIDADTKASQGFLTMQFSMDMMKMLHELAPSVVVRVGDRIVAYAIVLLQEGRHHYPDLESMFVNIETLTYDGRKMTNYDYYVMGQICVDKEYRGKDLVKLLYSKHKQLYEHKYDFIVTEISTTNHRSMKAHERIGFKLINTYEDPLDEWNVVLWNWS